MKYDVQVAEHINPYLVNAQDIIVTAREHPICDVPEIRLGNLPRDGGNLLLSEEDKDKIIQKDSLAQKWIRPFIGAEEFLNGKKRWCLWLVGIGPSELRKCKLIMERIEKVRRFRLNSKRIGTQKLASTPTLFAEIRQPDSNYMLIPSVTSSKRKLIPISFIDKNTIASDLLHIIPNARLYHFGVLSSIVHMAWMRAVCGRLGNEYRYSGSIVYNNFVWPSPTKSQKEAIEKAAQVVLDARNLYPDSTLADLYDPNTMPPELVKAHEKLDNAVKAAYGNEGFETEEEIVASLMKLYKEALEKENAEKKSIS